MGCLAFPSVLHAASQKRKYMWFWFTKDWDDFDVPLLKD